MKNKRSGSPYQVGYSLKPAVGLFTSSSIIRGMCSMEVDTGGTVCGWGAPKPPDGCLLLASLFGS